MENDNCSRRSTSYPGHMNRKAVLWNLNFATNIYRKMWVKYTLFTKYTMRHIYVELFYNDCKVLMGTFRYFYLELFSSR